MKLLVVKGSGGGGLGDSLRVVLIAILYAKLSGRALFIDWRHGLLGPPGENMFDCLFKIKDLATVSSIPKTDYVCPSTWISRAQKSLDEVYGEDGATSWNRQHAISKYSFDLSRLDYPHDVLFMWDFDQIEGLKTHLPREMVGLSDVELLNSSYMQHLQIENAIQDLVDQSWQFARSNPVIGVHLRMTDEYATNKGAASISSYCVALKSLRRRLPNAPIFLATDNSYCESWIVDKFKGVTTRPKWYNDSGQPLHLGTACPDRLQATRDALIEMLLLAKCDYLIRPANSSFSMLSAIIGKSHGIREIQVTPRDPWYKRALRLTHKQFYREN